MTLTTPGRILFLNFWRFVIILILGIAALVLLSNIKPTVKIDATAVPIVTPIPVNLPIPPKNPAESPGKEWQWRGKGATGSNSGSWYNPQTGESLHPDLNHPSPIGPHWDYKGPQGEWRIFPTGRIEAK